MSKTALLLVDLQEDFFNQKKGFLGKHAIAAETILAPIKALLQTLDSLPCSSCVVWVQSDYSVVSDFGAPDTDLDTLKNNLKQVCALSDEKSEEYLANIVSGTHSSKARRTCCIPKTFGHNIHDAFAELKSEKHYSVTKNWYSAFKNNEKMERILKDNEIERVIVCGVMAHVCVLATAVHAAMLGYKVTVPLDAVQSTRPMNYVKGLKILRYKGIEVCEASKVLKEFDPKPIRISTPWLGAGDCSIVYNLMDLEDHSKAFVKKLKDSLKFQTMNVRGNAVPRLITVQGTVVTDYKDGTKWEPLYRHPADDCPNVQNWNGLAKDVRDAASIQCKGLLSEEKEFKEDLDINHALIQIYRSGEDWISEHSDKVLDIEPNTPIFNASFGKPREMRFIHKRTLEEKEKGVEKHERVSQGIRLPSNSLFVMGWRTNRKCLHLIPKDMRVDNQLDVSDTEYSFRISFTFRIISTFVRRSDGFVKGLGAYHASEKFFDYPKPHDQLRVLMKAFSTDNAHGEEFDYESHYGSGFSLRTITIKPVLYWINGSISSWRAKFILSEFGIDHFAYRVKIMRKFPQTRSDFYLSINPRGKAPVLIDTDGSVVIESLAILLYLHGKSIKESELRPLVLARMQEVDNLILAFEDMELLFKNHSRLESREQRIEDSYQATFKEMSLWEDYLKAQDRPFIANTAEISLADFSFFPALGYIVRRGFPLQDFPHLNKYYNFLIERKSVKESAPSGWIGKQSATNLFEIVKEKLLKRSDEEKSLQIAPLDDEEDNSE